MRVRPPHPVLRSPRTFDTALAGALAVWSLAEVITGTAKGPAGAAFAAGMAMSAPLIWRRRWPVPVALLVAAAFFVEARLGVDTRTQVSTMAELPAAAYAAGAYAPLRAAVLVALTQCVAGATAQGAPSASGALFAVVVIGASAGAGVAMRSHRRRSTQLTAAVREQRQRAQAAVLEERARIARELHDIVAHAVSIMVIQAGAASEVLHLDPSGAGEALGSIQTTGRQALDELRRLLGVLRADTNAVTLTPQPGLGQLTELVEQVEATGLTVTLSVEGDLPHVPASLELSVYRIVQEALTNTVKHAGASHAEVRITCRPDGIDVQVADDGGGDRSGGRSPGHGLSGIRERAALYGGIVRTGADAGAGQGFAVHAWLPVSAPWAVGA